MIHVPRGAKPAILAGAHPSGVTNEEAWAQELCDKRAVWYQADAAHKAGNGPHPGDKPDAKQSRYGHRDVEQALEGMFGTKCAYCEGEIQATNFDQIEHYRPQSIYPGLAYTWTNLLQACGRCNGKSNKSDKFPVQPNGTTHQADKVTPCSLTDNDVPLLVNPCNEDPTQFLTFNEYLVIPVMHNGVRDKRGFESREVYGLQREALKDDRKRWYKAAEIIISMVLFARRHHHHTIVQKFESQLKDMVDAKHTYAGMIRVAAQKKGIDWRRL